MTSAFRARTVRYAALLTCKLHANVPSSTSSLAGMLRDHLSWMRIFRLPPRASITFSVAGPGFRLNRSKKPIAWILYTSVSPFGIAMCDSSLTEKDQISAVHAYEAIPNTTIDARIADEMKMIAKRSASAIIELVSQYIQIVAAIEMLLREYQAMLEKTILFYVEFMSLTRQGADVYQEENAYFSSMWDFLTMARNEAETIKRKLAELEQMLVDTEEAMIKCTMVGVTTTYARSSTDAATSSVNAAKASVMQLKNRTEALEREQFEAERDFMEQATTAKGSGGVESAEDDREKL